MRPLSEVFAPGAPTLPERLRTLVVSPERELEPGMTVRATFTFRNQGGAAATGVRLRFNFPEGLVYLVGTGRLDGNDLDDELGNSPLLARAGAHIGDVLPGEERRIEIAYSVAGAIENGTTVELQAALASFELPPVGSNVVRLIARSKPQLRNALTRIAIDAQHDPIPGSQAQVTIRIHNAGESSAHDVVVVAPIPEHAAYVAGSARVNGREIERDLGSPFDRTYAPIVVRSLPANGSATLVYRVRIDAPLPNGSQIVASSQIASQETPAFALEPASLTIVAAPDFGDDRTAFTADLAHDVRPGERVTMTLTAYNAGTADAERVNAGLELPDSLVWVRGASSIDGRATRERRKEPLRFALGRIDAGDQVELRIEAIVVSPLADGTILVPSATLEWEPSPPNSQRKLECAIAVRSEPAFLARRNFLQRRGREVVRPGDSLEATVVLANDGSAAAHDGVLHLRVAPALEEVAVFEGTTRLGLERPSAGSSYADTVDLGDLDALAARRLTIRARVPSPCADRSELRIGASLHTRELGETPLRDAFWRVDSHPAFHEETSRLELADESVLRPNQLAQIDVVVTNAGTDVAHNVALRLYISPEARLESVDGAGREKSSLLFGEIPAGGRARARLGLRLLRSLAKEYPVTVDGVLTADAVLPVPLARLTIETTAEPDFSVGSLRSEPAETVDVGEAVEWVLQVRNGGDGVAHHVQLVIATPDSLIYVPNSTTVNDVPVRDVGALPPFAAPRGIVLNEVDPGVEATIRWRTVVHNELPAGTSIVHVAHVRYDGERDDEIASAELGVRASPVFANAIPGLPFGLDGMLGPALAGEPRALAGDRFMQLPPATPVGDGNGAPLHAQLSSGRAPDRFESSESAGTLTPFTAERLERTLRFLREARFGSLVTHLFALRAFLPEAIGDAHRGAITPLRDLLREELDRLFIKLRLPNYVIAPRDIETPSLRSTIERVLDDAAAARGVPSDSPTAAIELRGNFLPRELRDFAERLSTRELASALPWAALARLMPDETQPLADYRTRLIAALDAFTDSDSSEFIDALQHRSDAELDATLDAVCALLHAAA
jgi:uncharacterized repeat protein (TIGR01451 family)